MQIKKHYVQLQHPIKDVLVNFGKYAEARMTWGDVPRDYIELLLASKRLEVHAYEEELKRRDLIEEADAPSALRLLLAGRNALVLLCHPDRGGNPDEFRQVMADYEALKELVAQAQQPT